MMAWVAVFTIVSKNYFHRRLGGVTGDIFGAVGELSETSVMVLLALGTTMNQRKQIITVYLFAVSLIVLYCHDIFAADAPAPAQRVVSLAPSVTETLFALGFGDRVVGVTTYCDYPAEARRLPKIGGFTESESGSDRRNQAGSRNRR